MSAESWFMLAATAAILVAAIACPVLAWVSVTRTRASLERYLEGRLAALDRLMRALEARLDRLERSANGATGEGDAPPPPSPRIRAAGAVRPITAAKRHQPGPTRIGGEDSTLIAVPNLATAANDRDAAAMELKERYAAIWSLAATGSSAEVIARATGQPIGQIELILGLRRQIDGNRTTIPHAPHT